MTTALYDFAEIEAKTAKPLTVNMVIRDVLRANQGACYGEIERYLMPPGLAGSKTFDQAYAVAVLLEHDEGGGKRIAAFMKTTGMSRRILWDRLQRVLRQVGFQMKHGRLVGVLEDLRVKENDADNGGDEIGQPDID